MSTDDATKAAEAAVAVMTALQPLSADERSRVLLSAAALFGVSIAPQVAANQGGGNGGGGVGAGAPTGAAANLGSGSGKRRSVVELIQDRGAVTNAQRIACFAYYREKFEGESNFASLDLAAYFPQAKLAAPANYSRDYAAAVKEGWIHDEGAKSYLTQTGEKAIEAGFGGKGRPRGATAGKKRKASKSE